MFCDWSSSGDDTIPGRALISSGGRGPTSVLNSWAWAFSLWDGVMGTKARLCQLSFLAEISGSYIPSAFLCQRRHCVSKLFLRHSADFSMKELPQERRSAIDCSRDMAISPSLIYLSFCVHIMNVVALVVIF